MNARLLTISIAAIAVVAAIGAAVVFFQSDEVEDGTTLSSMTPQQLYDAVEAKLAEQDDVLHVVALNDVDGIYDYQLRGEMWFDPRHDVMRSIFTLLVESEEERVVSQALLTATEYYEVQSGRPETPPGADGSSVTTSRWQLCMDSGVAASSLLGCGSATAEAFQQQVEEGKRDGRSVVVLVTTTTVRGSDQTTASTTRLYLDAKTLLPMHAESSGLSLGEPPVPFTASIAYETVEYLPRSGLAADFFTPEAIGWKARDPEEGLKAVSNMQRYWLGAEFSASNVEPLVLQGSFAAPGDGSPYQYSLQYARKAAPYEPPFLSMQVFRIEKWRQVSGAIDPNRVIVLGDVVVFFVESSFPGQAGILDAAGALDALKAGLQPYQ